MADSITDFGINLLEEEIDDVIFQTNEFLTDATFTGQSGPFWWISAFLISNSSKALSFSVFQKRRVTRLLLTGQKWDKTMIK